MISGRAEDSSGAKLLADAPGHTVAPAITSPAQRVWTAGLRFLIGAMLIIELYSYINIEYKYPFYFLCDMDQLAATDALGLNSGMIPRAIVHPGFGMHLMNHWIHVSARGLGLVSAYNLHDVETSLNPLLVVAELTGFLRQFPPILCIAIVVFLWLSVVIHFQLSPGESLVALLAISTPQSLLYQSAMIRFEVYSMFYWSAAVLVIVLATRSRRPVILWGLVVIAGVLLGLSYLSKVQALFYVLAFPLIALFLFYTGPVWGQENPRFSKRLATVLTSITALGLAIFSTLLAAAAMTKFPDEIIDFKRLGLGQDMGPPWVGFGLAFAASLLTLFQALNLNRAERMRGAYAISAITSSLFFGVVMSSFLHFLIFPDPRRSLEYLIYDTKMAWAFPSLYQTEGIWYYVELVSKNVAFSWVLYTILAFAMIVLVGMVALRRIPIRRLVLVFPVLVCLLMAANLAFCVRFILRDLIWTEMLATFLAVVIFFLIFQKCTSNRAIVRTACIILLLALSVSNLLASRLMVDRIDAAYNLFGWTPEPWFGTWWNSDRYKNALHAENDSARDAVFASARRYRESKRIEEYVFKNVRPDLRGVGVVSEGLPVWRDNLAVRITKFPAALRGGVVYDISWQHPEPGVFFTKMDHHEENLQKIVPSPGARPGSQATPGEWLSILGRPDLRVYLFLEKPDLERVVSERSGIAARDISIALSDGRGSLEFWGAEIQSYCEIPVGKISSRYFFVVMPNLNGRSAWLALWP